MPSSYDVIVIGAGHAGCEAALASARMGCETLLFNITLDTMALMSCNPAIGGLAKGQLVKEVDALGGQMGRIADRTAVHFRTLNASKGPAVQATRFQCDKQLYRLAMKTVLERQPHLHLRQGLVNRLVVEGGRIIGVEDDVGLFHAARAVIVTAGTFMNGLIHIGASRIPAGRAGEAAATALAASLRDLGFPMGRLKTGTPPRLKATTIDFSVMERQDSDPEPQPFSFTTTALRPERLPSFFTYTTGATHAVMRENIAESALYSGRISGIGARYCPSLEDKVMRFADKDRHPVVLEYEGLDTEEIYAKGLGNSLPPELQARIVHSVPGLEEAEILRWAYAIEYDFVQPTALWATLETKAIRGLYLAGQVNGTSGYEEAAAQGLWAGINAASVLTGRPAFILSRADAYMGVLVDDLVTRGVDEPYRMFTSRAEYRLLLREDNAALRLARQGRALGLLDRGAYERVAEWEHRVAAGMVRLSERRIYPVPAVNDALVSLGAPPIKNPMSLFQLLKRDGMTYGHLQTFDAAEREDDPFVRRALEIEAKYEGYIARQQEQVARLRAQEAKRLPPDFDYSAVPGLSKELQGKFASVRPATVAQAERIPGMTSAAITAVLVALKKMEEKGRPASPGRHDDKEHWS